MSEKRTFDTAICVKKDGRTLAKLELFPADQWQDGQQGLFRVRRNRSWLEGSSGPHVYRTPKEIGELVASLFGGSEPPAPPVFARGELVSVPNGRIRFGQPMRDVTRVVMDSPMRDASGQWYVAVQHPGGGVRLVPANEVQPR